MRSASLAREPKWSMFHQQIVDGTLGTQNKVCSIGILPDEGNILSRECKAPGVENVFHHGVKEDLNSGVTCLFSGEQFRECEEGSLFTLKEFRFEGSCSDVHGV